MAQRLLDTNILIRTFRLKLRPYRNHREEDARATARWLIEERKTKSIVTPVRVEFLAGLCDKHEMKLAEAFLAEFDLLDRGELLPPDWQAFENYAKRIPPEDQPRQLGDALLFALARRLRCEIDSNDLALTRHQGRYRRPD